MLVRVGGGGGERGRTLPRVGAVARDTGFSSLFGLCAQCTLYTLPCKRRRSVLLRFLPPSCAYYLHNCSDREGIGTQGGLRGGGELRGRVGASSQGPRPWTPPLTLRERSLQAYVSQCQTAWVQSTSRRCVWNGEDWRRPKYLSMGSRPHRTWPPTAGKTGRSGSGTRRKGQRASRC